MRTVKSVLPALSIVLLLITYSCRNEQAPPTEEIQPTQTGQVSLSAAQLSHAGLAFGKIEEKLLSSDLPARGRLILPPERHATVTSVSGGIITSIQVIQGSRVAAGQVLAYVSDPQLLQLQQDYLESKAVMEFLEKDYQRQLKLNKDEINAAKVLQKAEADREEFKARVQGMASRLRQAGIDPARVSSEGLVEKIPLRCPITGKIEKVMVRLGEHLSPESPVFEVVDTRQLFLEMAVFEKDILSVKEGQRVTFDLGNLDKGGYEAKVLSIGSVVHDEARVVSVLASFSNEDGLMPGMFAAAKIHAGEKLYKAIPEDAILARSEKEQYIFFTTDADGSDPMTFSRVEVKTGFREDGWVQVGCAKSLPEGARVVVAGVYYVWAEMEKVNEE